MKKQFCLFITVVLLTAGCSKKASPSTQEGAAPAVPVQTANVEVRTVPLFFEALGQVKPHISAEIKPQVKGILTGVHFTEGQWVEAGDLLFTVEETPYAIKVQEMQALLLQDQAHLKNAQKKLKRYKSLSSQDLIAQVEWDEAETQVNLYKAMVKADKARLASAALDLEHCRILAPISGYVGKTALQAGNIADASALVTILQPEPFYVDFAITEKELQKLSSSGLHVEVFSCGSDERLASGEIIFLDRGLNAATGMLAARAVLSPSSKQLWAGQSVRVHLFFGEKKDAMLIPLKAIKTNQNGPYVFSVKEDSTVEMLSVKLGPEEPGVTGNLGNKTWIVVEEGLNAASKVVVEGQSRLFPGSKVEEVR